MTWYNKWVWVTLGFLPFVFMLIASATFSAARPPLKWSAEEAVESFWSPSSWGAVSQQESARSAAGDSYVTATAAALGFSQSTLWWTTLGFFTVGVVAAGTILAGAKSYAPAVAAAVATPAAAATPAGAGISFVEEAPVEAPVVVVATPVVKKKVIGRPKGATNKPAWVATPPKQRSPAWVAPKQKPPVPVGQPVPVGG